MDNDDNGIVDSILLYRPITAVVATVNSGKGLIDDFYQRNSLNLGENDVNYVIFDKRVFCSMKRGSFFKNYPFHREDKWKPRERMDCGIDEGREDIRDVAKENPYSNRGMAL